MFDLLESFIASEAAKHVKKVYLKLSALSNVITF